jgi:hypothetical protein
MVDIDKKYNGKNKGKNNGRKKGKKCAQNKMKCEIEKRIKENGEKIKYIKSELEKKGLKVRISVVNLDEMDREERIKETEEGEKETIKYKEEENEETIKYKEEGENEETIKYKEEGEKEEKIKTYEKKSEDEKVKKGREWKKMWDLNMLESLYTERKEVREDPKRVSNPYEKFKKYLDNAILRKEKTKGLERLRGGGIKKGGMGEKEMIIKIEVEA